MNKLNNKNGGAMKKIKVVILEDNQTLINGIRFELEKPDISVCGIGEDLENFLSIMRSCKPDIAIVDLRIWNDYDGGFTAISKAREISASTKYVVYTAYDDPSHFHRAINLGIKGFVAKKFNETPLDTIIRIIANGGTYFGDMLEKYLEIVKDNKISFPTESEKNNLDASLLTITEFEILQLLDQDYDTNKIASLKSISPHTVKAHTSAIRRKLSASSTQEAIRIARLNRILGKNS